MERGAVVDAVDEDRDHVGVGRERLVDDDLRIGLAVGPGGARGEKEKRAKGDGFHVRLLGALC
jgi:hypothetical protein